MARTLDAVKYIGDVTWWRFVTPVTGIHIDTEKKIRPNHLVNLIFVWPGERLLGEEAVGTRSICQCVASAREHCSERNLKRRLTSRVNLAALMHCQPHAYIIDYLSESLEKIDHRYCLVFMRRIDLRDWRLWSTVLARDPHSASFSPRSFAYFSYQNSSK